MLIGNAFRTVGDIDYATPCETVAQQTVLHDAVVGVCVDTDVGVNG